MPEHKESRDWTLFLSDMQLFSSKVIRYCHGLSAKQFAADDVVTDAGCATSSCSEKQPSRSPIPCANAIQRFPGGGSQVCETSYAHAYFGLEDETIWQIVSNSVPALSVQLNAVALAEGLPVNKDGTGA